MVPSRVVQTGNIPSASVASTVNVLILDDSEFDRKRIRRLFQTAGLTMSLDEVETLTGMNEMLNETIYDIVLVDYNLAEGNGIDAVQLMRRHPKNATAKAIMITGDDKSDVAVQALKMGCEDYLSKAQLTAERLKEAVVSSIAKRASLIDDTLKVDQMAEDLARDILSELSSVLQPKLAHMLRDVRALKRQLMLPETNVPGRLEVLDKTCVQMWKALAEAPNLCEVSKNESKLH